MISVIICTRNRHNQLINALESLQKSNLQDFEVIVVDQSSNSLTKHVVTKFAQSLNVRYFFLKAVGRTNSLNTAIRKAKGQYLAFTDDDCIIHKNWLSEISKFFTKHKDIHAIFGNTYPFRSNKKTKLYCPATFYTKAARTITKIEQLSFNNDFGQANNMAIRRKVFRLVGNFNPWLGLGKPGQSAEDYDLIFRMVSFGLSISTNPKMIIYHDRWLTYGQFRRASFIYNRGILAFHSSYIFTKSGPYHIKLILKKILRVIINFQQIYWVTRKLLLEIYFSIGDLVSILVGLLVGLVNSFLTNFSKQK